MQFQDLALAEPILRAVAEEGYHTPTPIQAQAIPHVINSKDLMGCAQTGTGKTAAFALPMLHRLLATAPEPQHVPAGPAVHRGRQHHRGDHHHGGERHGQPKRQIRGLVLSPTRELAMQIGESFATYGRYTGLKHFVIFGGVGQGPQTDALKRGIDVLVATPGRLLDLMQQGFVDLRHVEFFVLDEADRMLDMGFIHDIRKIVAKLPHRRQNLMFSATMPEEIRSLANSILVHPVRVEVAPVSSTAERVDQSVYFVEKRLKPFLLRHLLKTIHITRALVFTRTKHGADRVVRQLFKAGVKAEAIHGDKSQGQRQRALNNFKSGKSPILVATDIAARGIDVDEVSHVFNYDIPNEPETYVHRIGRTGRAGATGVAIAFCDSEERSFLRQIERLTKKQIAVLDDHPEYPKLEDRPEHERQLAGAGASGGGEGHGGHHAARPAHSAGGRSGQHTRGRGAGHGHPRTGGHGGGSRQGGRGRGGRGGGSGGGGRRSH